MNITYQISKFEKKAAEMLLAFIEGSLEKKILDQSFINNPAAIPVMLTLMGDDHHFYLEYSSKEFSVKVLRITGKYNVFCDTESLEIKKETLGLLYLAAENYYDHKF